MNASIERLRDWIEKADHDLGTAIVINEHLLAYSETLAFHCQQAVEKYIKCLLEFHSVAYRRSHDLRYLLDLLNDFIPISPEQYLQAMKLNGFSVEIRYPEIKINLTPEARNEAIEIVRTFRKFVKENVTFEIDETLIV